MWEWCIGGGGEKCKFDTQAQLSSDEELQRARRAGRPKTGNAKQLIAIRIDPRFFGAAAKVGGEAGQAVSNVDSRAVGEGCKESYVIEA